MFNEIFSSERFNFFAEFLVLQTTFAKVWPASLQIRPCFLTLAKIGDTEIFAKMVYGTVTYMYDDLYILTYRVKGNCRIREVDPSSFLVNKKKKIILHFL